MDAFGKTRNETVLGMNSTIFDGKVNKRLAVHSGSAINEHY